MSILRSTIKNFPGLWDEVESAREKYKGKFPFWCYCPSDLMFENAEFSVTPASIGHLIWMAAAAASWRPTQSIYRFEPDLYDALIRTPLKKIPADVLYQLPEWCVCIETPTGIKIGPYSFMKAFAWMEYSVDSGSHILSIMMLSGDDIESPETEIACYPLNISKTADIEAAIDIAAEKSKIVCPAEIFPGANKGEFFEEDVRNSIGRVVNLVLYLCAKNANYKGQRPARPNPVKTKKGWRIFPADHPTIRIMGAPEPEAMPSGGGSGGSKAPHIRSAHWHTYRVGKGRTKRELRWVSTIRVGSVPGKE